jgi:xanthine dehydrogenase accessory factor
MRADILHQLLADREAKRPVVLASDLETGEGELIYPGENGADGGLREAAEAAARADKSRVVEHEGRRLFLNVHNPPLRLIIVGAVHIAQPLSRIAALAGYDVTVVDPRGAFATSERFPATALMHEWPDDAMRALAPDRRTAVVTLTHDPKLDDPALLVVLRSPAFYVGCLGSTRTHAKRKERLAEEGLGEAEMARIHGPIGLDIGAKSPAEIAVAIVAEVTECLRRAAA